VIGQASFHRWRHAQALVYPTEIIIREVQSASCFVVVQLLAESVGQAREAADCHANREILPLDVAGGDVARVGATAAYLDYGFYHRRRRVASGSVVLPVIAVYFYDLRNVCLSCEHILDPATVKHAARERARWRLAQPVQTACYRNNPSTQI
jgi:hypothetical protein